MFSRRQNNRNLHRSSRSKVYTPPPRDLNVSYYVFSGIFMWTRDRNPEEKPNVRVEASSNKLRWRFTWPMLTLTCTCELDITYSFFHRHSADDRSSPGSGPISLEAKALHNLMWEFHNAQQKKKKTNNNLGGTYKRPFSPPPPPLTNAAVVLREVCTSSAIAGRLACRSDPTPRFAWNARHVEMSDVRCFERNMQLNFSTKAFFLFRVAFKLFKCTWLFKRNLLALALSGRRYCRFFSSCSRC